ncbi:hypothetical protein GCM10010149_05020 [Nonomuraea roseoviolacea subsp. roseoviolacea]
MITPVTVSRPSLTPRVASVRRARAAEDVMTFTGVIIATGRPVTVTPLRPAPRRRETLPARAPGHTDQLSPVTS